MPKMSFTLQYDGRQLLHIEGDARDETHALKSALDALIYSVTRAATGHAQGTAIMDDVRITELEPPRGDRS